MTKKPEINAGQLIELLKQLPTDSPIRIWLDGERYSIMGLDGGDIMGRIEMERVTQ